MADVEKVGFLKKLWQSYEQLCKDMGVEQGGCRSCVPKYQFDENGKRIETRLPEMKPHSPENKD